jgi:hypothetical protein
MWKFTVMLNVGEASREILLCERLRQHFVTLRMTIYGVYAKLLNLKNVESVRERGLLHLLSQR